MPKGGARREKVPEVDLSHLTDSLLDHVRHLGVESAFHLGNYLGLERQQAVVGPDLVDALPILRALYKVQPTLAFKYSDLVEALKGVLRQFPRIRDFFEMRLRPTLQKKLADALLVLCNHSRRIGRDKAKYHEAGRKLTDFQLEKLEEIWGWFNEEQTPQKKKKKTKQESEAVSPAKSAQSAASHLTAELLNDFEVPATQDSLEAEVETVEPVPARKRALKKEVAGLKRPASCQRPAASVKKIKKEEKKSVGGLPDDWVLGSQELIFMPYLKTGAMALRIEKGPQVLQILSKEGLESSKDLASQAYKKLKAGQTLGQVRAWKKKALQ